MELIKAIESRRSIRKFKSDSVPDSLIKELLKAARLAPSGSNLQPSRYVIIKSEEMREKLNECTPLPFVTKAPVIIACCVDKEAFDSREKRYNELKEAGAFADTPLENTNPNESSKKRTIDESTAKAYLWLNSAIGIDHITLRAEDLGLGTCWVMMIDHEKAKEILQLEDRYEVVALLPVGYPDQSPSARPRLTLDEILLKEL